MKHASLFKEARAIAQHCYVKARRDHLRTCCDEAQEVFDRFNISASRLDMEALVAAWTRLLLAMDAIGPFVMPPDRQGGRLGTGHSGDLAA